MNKSDWKRRLTFFSTKLVGKSPAFSKPPKQKSIYRGVRRDVKDIFNECENEAGCLIAQCGCGRRNPLHSTASEDSSAVPGSTTKYVRNALGDQSGIVRVDTAPYRRIE